MGGAEWRLGVILACGGEVNIGSPAAHGILQTTRRRDRERVDDGWGS